jgi:hypothetical protein
MSDNLHAIQSVSESHRVVGVQPTGKAVQEIDTTYNYDDGSHQTSIVQYSFQMYDQNGKSKDYQNTGGNINIKA